MLFDPYRLSYDIFNNPQNENSQYNENTPIPLIFTLLLTDSLFPKIPTSPAAAMLIPLKIWNIPFSYFIIIALGFATSLLAKWSYTFSGIPPLSQYQQAYPDIWLYRQGLSQPSQTRTTVSGRDSAAGSQEEPPTPLTPETEGLAILVSLFASYSGVPESPGSKFVLIYGIEVFRIKYLPKIFIPLLTLLIYFFFYPKYQKMTNNAAAFVEKGWS